MPATELPDIVITPCAATLCWRLCSFFINCGFIVIINTNIIWMFFRGLIKCGTFQFLLHPRHLLRWLLMAFQVPAQWQSESFYWICYDTHALPGLGSHRCSSSWAHIIRGISQVLFGQEGLLLSFPAWQNNLGGMGGGLLERGGRIPCAQWAVIGFKLLWGPGCLEGKAMMMVMKLQLWYQQYVLEWS